MHVNKINSFPTPDMARSLIKLYIPNRYSLPSTSSFIDKIKEFKPTVTIIIFGICMLLSCVNVVFLFWPLFPVFPRIQAVACVFYSQSNFIGSYFPNSPHRPAFFD